MHKIAHLEREVVALRVTVANAHVRETQLLAALTKYDEIFQDLVNESDEHQRTIACKTEQRRETIAKAKRDVDDVLLATAPS